MTATYNIYTYTYIYIYIYIYIYDLLYLEQETLMPRYIYRMIQGKDEQEEVKSRLMSVSLAISWNVLAPFLL